MERTASRTAIGATLMAVTGVGLIGYAIWFIVQNFAGLIEIGLSPVELGKTREEIWAFSPGVYNYISHLQVALGGFMAATGRAIAFAAWFGVRQRESWAWWAVMLTTVLWAGVTLQLHYVYGFGTLAHLGLGYVALTLIAIGGYLARPGR